MRKNITAARLRSRLHYDPETGIWTWLKTGNSQFDVRFAGTRAGNVTQGYRNISVDGILYRSSRLAYLYMTGEHPEHTIDHVNNIRDDDRWINLRPATHSQNCRNRRLSKLNKQKLKGVRFRPDRKKKYFAMIYIKSRRKATYLGSFTTPEAAHEAYIQAATSHFGQFANKG